MPSILNNPTVDDYLGETFESLGRTWRDDSDINLSKVSTALPLGSNPYRFMNSFLSKREPLYIPRTKLKPLLYLEKEPKTVDRGGNFVARRFQVFVCNSPISIYLNSVLNIRHHFEA